MCGGTTCTNALGTLILRAGGSVIPGQLAVSAWPCRLAAGVVRQNRARRRMAELMLCCACAQALGKPLIVEEFGKAHSAAKVYTDELPNPLQAGGCPASATCAPG